MVFLSILDILMPTANTRRFGNFIHANSTFASRFALNMNSGKMGTKYADTEKEREQERVRSKYGGYTRNMNHREKVLLYF